MAFSVLACLGSVDHACRYVIVDVGSVLLDDVVDVVTLVVGAVVMVEDGWA